MHLFIKITDDRNPIIEEFDNSVKMVEEFAKKNEVPLGHFKKTCPNPASGEKHYGFRKYGVIIDLVEKVGLWTSWDEYDLMWNLSKENKKEVKAEDLPQMEDPFHLFRGMRIAKRFKV